MQLLVLELHQLQLEVSGEDLVVEIVCPLGRLLDQIGLAEVTRGGRVSGSLPWVIAADGGSAVWRPNVYGFVSECLCAPCAALRTPGYLPD